MTETYSVEQRCAREALVMEMSLMRQPGNYLCRYLAGGAACGATVRVDTAPTGLQVPYEHRVIGDPGVCAVYDMRTDEPTQSE